MGLPSTGHWGPMGSLRASGCVAQSAQPLSVQRSAAMPLSSVNQESYSLNHISHIELGKAKIDYSDYGSLHTLYKQNYPLFLEYNVKDVTLVEDLEDKMGLLELTMTMAYNAKIGNLVVFCARLTRCIFDNQSKSQSRN